MSVLTILSPCCRNRLRKYWMRILLKSKYQLIFGLYLRNTLPYLVNFGQYWSQTIDLTFYFFVRWRWRWRWGRRWSCVFQIRSYRLRLVPADNCQHKISHSIGDDDSCCVFEYQSPTNFNWCALTVQITVIQWKRDCLPIITFIPSPHCFLQALLSMLPLSPIFLLRFSVSIRSNSIRIPVPIGSSAATFISIHRPFHNPPLKCNPMDHNPSTTAPFKIV